jgi:signal transduction histidine kinase
VQRPIRIIIIFLLLASIAGLLLPILRSPEMNRLFSEQLIMELSLVDKWEGIDGDLRFDENGAPIVEGVQWLSLAELQKSEDKRSGEYYWLRRQIPKHDYHDPQLIIHSLRAYEVYIDGKQEASSFMPPSPPLVNLLYSWSVIPVEVDTDQEDAMLYLRVYHYGMEAPYSFGTIQLSSGGAFLRTIGTDSIPTLGFGFLFLIIGLIGLVIYIRKPRDLLYASFTLFALSVAVGAFNSTIMLHLYFRIDWLAYTPDLSLPLGVYALILFLEQVSHKGYRTFYRILGVILLLFTALYAISAHLFITFYDWLSSPVMPSFIIAICIVAGGVLTLMYRQSRRTEIAWLLTGFIGALTGLSFNYLFSYFIWERIMYSTAVSPWAILVADNSLFIGLCWLFFTLVMAMYTRYTALNNQVRKYAEDTATKLQESLRDTAAAIAELSVMEERNRMARDIHDIVGHTLTTTIVKIEAARMLADKKRDEAIEHLEETSQLVRRTLESLRESMHKLSNSDSEWDLRDAMSKLIAETIQATGVSIEYDIEQLPNLRVVHMRVLFHALQEGLTNGIRHGGATSFQFILRSDGKLIHFILENTGAPYASLEFGFGLTAMRERVEGLGGEISVTDNGIRGCLITITLPQPAAYSDRA